MHKIYALTLMLLALPLAAFELPLYPAAQLLEQTAPQSGQQRLILGKNRRTQSGWQFELEQRIDGALDSRLYQLQGTDSFRQIVAFYREQLVQAGLEQLFVCSGRDCGSSNVWANNFFTERRLYGPDDNQHYWALKSAGAYYMLYLVDRGNQRIYLRIDRIVPDGKALAAALLLDAQCQHAQLASYLQQAGNQPLLLLVSVTGDFDQQQSRALAQRCQQLLSAMGVEINAVGLGAFDSNWQPVQQTRLQLQPR